MIDLLFYDRETLDYRRDIILTYCDALLDTREDKQSVYMCFDNDEYRYDPRQSLFMYTMCVNIDEKSNEAGMILDQTYRYRNYKKQFKNISYK